MHKLKYACLIIVTTFLMGIAFPVGKLGLSYAPPFLLMGIRFVLAGGLLALFCYKRKQPMGKMQWLQAAIIGLFQSAGVMGCAFFSMRWITSSESAILTTSSPLFVIIMGTLVAGAVYRVRQWFGVAIGFVGVAIALGFHLGMQPGTFISLAGAVSFASATLFIKRWSPNFDLNVLAAYQMLAGGIALLLMSFVTEHPFLRSQSHLLQSCSGSRSCARLSSLHSGFICFTAVILGKRAPFFSRAAFRGVHQLAFTR